MQVIMFALMSYCTYIQYIHTYLHTIAVILGPAWRVDDQVDVVAASDLNGPIPSLYQKLNPPSSLT